jgi:NADPH:quinone reductase-like Zn-dependent oxidoreductase
VSLVVLRSWRDWSAIGEGCPRSSSTLVLPLVLPLDACTERHLLTCDRRTTYNGGPVEFQETPLNDLLKQIEAGTMKVQIGKVFHLDEIVEAHRCMEENRAGGKIVVLT